MLSLLLCLTALPAFPQEPPVLRTWNVSAALFGYVGFALLADVDGDGDPELLLGDPAFSPPSPSNAGRVRVVSSSGPVLFEHVGTAAHQRLGNAVAPVGDVNGDGDADYLVGASPIRPARIHSGADGALLFEAPAAAQDAAALGDVDQDGFDDFLLARIPQVTFYLGGSFHVRQTFTTPLDAAFFGARVLVLGDVDADGFPDFAVAALGEGFKISPPGEVFVYSGRTGAELHRIAGNDQNDRFGEHMAAPGDVTGDGIPDLVVGTAIPFLALGRLTYLDGATGTRLVPSALGGAIVDLDAAGDVNGDGFPDLVHGLDDLFSDATRVVDGHARTLLLERPQGPFDLVAGGGHDWNDDTFPDFLVARPDRIELLSGAPPRTEIQGQPCGTILGRAPRIGATGAPTLGQPYPLHLSDVPPFAPAVLRIGPFGPGALAPAAGLRGCAFPGPKQAQFAVLTEKIGPGRGAATVAFAIPADPSLLDLRFSAQWTVLAPGGQPLASTRVLRARIGP